MRMVPVYLNAGSPIVGNILEGLGCVAVLKEVIAGEGGEFQKPTAFQLSPSLPCVYHLTV